MAPTIPPKARCHPRPEPNAECFRGRSRVRARQEVTSCAAVLERVGGQQKLAIEPLSLDDTEGL